MVNSKLINSWTLGQTINRFTSINTSDCNGNGLCTPTLQPCYRVHSIVSQETIYSTSIAENPKKIRLIFPENRYLISIEREESGEKKIFAINKHLRLSFNLNMKCQALVV